ncbi:MAG TPA: amidohydrolase family protein [Vicinamibacteria bacterium]|nr:amidohydrolase family protein [Vicinamibacteria bacterium]
MRHAIALKREFDLDLYIHHARNTDELVDELVEAEVPISFGPILPFMGRENPQIMGPVRLAQRGGKVAFHADHPDTHQYFLRHSASLFVRKGMPEEVALAALTLNPAKLFHLDDRIGNLEVGKDADFVIMNGPPLDFESLVQQVFIDGREVFNRATAENAFGQRVPEGW